MLLIYCINSNYVILYIDMIIYLFFLLKISITWIKNWISQHSSIFFFVAFRVYYILESYNWIYKQLWYRTNEFKLSTHVESIVDSKTNLLLCRQWSLFFKYILYFFFLQLVNVELVKTTVRQKCFFLFFDTIYVTSARIELKLRSRNFNNHQYEGTTVLQTHLCQSAHSLYNHIKTNIHAYILKLQVSKLRRVHWWEKGDESCDTRWALSSRVLSRFPDITITKNHITLLYLIFKRKIYKGEQGKNGCLLVSVYAVKNSRLCLKSAFKTDH